MTLLRNLIRCLLIFLALPAFFATAANLGALNGVVRDSEGHSLADATVTLTDRQTPPASFRTTTAPSGEYRFTAVPSGEYSLQVELAGYVSPSPLNIRIGSEAAPVTTDLKLSRSSPAPGSGTPAASQPAATHPLLEFQASGIRGVIDPGGYSASTTGASSEYLRGMADVKRTDKISATPEAKDWPCGLEPELREAVTEHPNQAESNRRLGEFYEAHSDSAEAIPFLRRALQIDGADFVALRNLALAQLQTGDFENARKLLISLVEHHSNLELHQLLARSFEGSGMFPQAANEYRLAQALAPSEANLFGVAYELILAGSAADGVTAFQAAVQTYPQSISLRLGLGTAQLLKGDVADGICSLLDATDIDPDDARPYTVLANATTNSADQSYRVLKTFKRYLDRAPNSADANYFYALALSRENTGTRASQVEPLLKRAIQLNPNLARAHLQLAELYADRGNYTDAVPEYEAAERLEGNLTEVHYELAKAYKRIGKAELSAHELQIFRQAKTRERSANEKVDLAQFISVMADPNLQTRPVLACPIERH